MRIVAPLGAAVFALLQFPPVPCFPQDVRAPAPQPATAASAAPQPAQPAQPGAKPAAASPRADLSVWIGATLSDVYAQLGAPLSVRAVRGPEPWQDDVVFSFDSIELYCLKDRVWQVRSDSGFALKRGADRDSVTAALGEPLHRLDSDFVYQLPGHAWPVRLRVRFSEDGGLSDIYVYRADF